MYELFYYPNNASLAPHFVLEETGAPFELRLVDRRRSAQKDPAYMQHNPMGRIPTLIDGELVLFESAAICLHLADRHPEAALVPPVATNERAHLYKWLTFLTNTIQPDFMSFYYPDRYTADGRGTEAVKAAAESRLAASYSVVDDTLERGGPYLLGSSLSIADFFLWMLVHWGSALPNRPTNLPAIRRCVDLVSKRPSVQRALETEGRVVTG